MLKIVIGFVVAFGLGAFCRWMDVPVPAPNKLVGALLVLAVTLGYITTDRVLTTDEQASGVAAGQPDPDPDEESGRPD